MRPQALVTGGSRGIGRAICLKLAQAGYDVAFTYRSNHTEAESLCAELTKLGAKNASFAVDQSDATAIENCIDQITAAFPQITVLVNNAGVSIDGLTLRYSVADWDKTFNTNVRSGFLFTQSLLKPMMKARNGSVIFISSVVGESGNAGQAVYSASKSALFGLAKSLAQEMASRNIRVNVVTPGFIKTDMTESLPEKTKESILSQIPLGCLGTTEDVADAVLFLAGSSSKYITGQVLAVNGGMRM